MPTYKLSYFEAQAVGEPIRLLLSYGGCDFIDDRYTDDTFHKIRPLTPYGLVPILEIDGKKMHQSLAICRYLAKQFGLYGRDDWECYEIDATVDTLYDFRNKTMEYYFEDHPEVKAKKKLESKTTVPFYIERLEKQVKENGGYFVGGRLTFADLVFFGIYNNMNYLYEGDIIAKAENLKALMGKILAVPNIKSWVDRRPKNDF